MKRKGQAALEFISTYGWAILVVLVMIGALTYFGVTNPQRLLPDKCVLTTGIQCVDYTVQSSGASSINVRFTLQNAMGESIIINSVRSTYSNLPSLCTIDGGASTTVAPDDRRGYTCAFATNPGAGQPVRAMLNISYRPVTGAYNKTASGELYSKVQ